MTRSESFSILEDIAILSKDLWVWLDDEEDKKLSGEKMIKQLDDILDKYDYLERKDDT